MIYQVIEKAGNKGIWTRDIKTATSVNQNTLTKTLKSLEGRHLIKTAKSVTSKSKKLYMLFELSEWGGRGGGGGGRGIGLSPGAICAVREAAAKAASTRLRWRWWALLETFACILSVRAA